MKKISTAGIYPIPPATSIAIGDYGYFDNGKWHRMGNITSIKGYRCNPEVKENPLQEQEMLLHKGIQFESELNANASCGGADIGCKLTFTKSNAYYIKAIMTKEEVFDSIDIEIKNQLQKLDEAGVWDRNYCLVVSVAYAKSSFSIFAKEAGGSIQLLAKSPDGISSGNVPINAGFSAGAELNKSNVEIVDRKESDSPHPFGFSIVKYTRGWDLDKKIKYADEGTDKYSESYTIHRDSEEKPQAIFG